MLGDIINMGVVLVKTYPRSFSAQLTMLKSSLGSFWSDAQEMVPWWSWYYYINPVSWTLYAIIITQLGDDTHVVGLSLR